MDLQHVNVKVFVDGDLPVGLDQFVEVFHRWTSEQSMEEMLIDVADYAHVPAGPGIVLIGHEADYALDHADERWGLLYNRKAIVDGDSLACLEQAFRAATHACALLEAEFAAEQLKFDRHRLRAVVNDRALAPNTAETLTDCQPVLEAFAEQVFASGTWEIMVDSEPRRRFAVEIHSPQAFALAERPTIA